ncbi:MAG: insulinase family protein [Cyclobacteriaceae bacterium]|nr:insulinase family protein [Cyclobacteriaceae bacterium HetDA_MAG_MS6]
MLDRSIAPSPEPLKTVDFPQAEYLQIAGCETLLLRSSNQPVVVLELILSSGRWTEKRPGISYFGSKMILEGTPQKTAEQISFAFEALGSYVEINPGFDHQTIKLYTLKRFFEKSVSMLFELFDKATFPSEEFALMKTIRQQNLQNQLSKPNQFASLKLTELLYGQEHPYGRIIIPEMVEPLTREQAHEYFQWVLFRNPKIVLVGDVEDSQIDFLNQMFKRLESNTVATEKFLPQTSIGDHEINRQANQASVRIGKITIPKHHPDIHKLSIANTILGGFFGSRLMKNIREEKGLTYGIHSSIVHLAEHSYWTVGSELAKDKLTEGLSEIQKEINILCDQPPTEDELETVRNYLSGKLMTSMDSVFGLASLYKSTFLFGMDPTYFSEFMSTLQSIQSADISEVASTYLQGELVNVVVQ